MLSLSEIKNYYPDQLKRFDRFIMREYLQYKLLEIIFESPFASKLSFLGGTCLRIVHGNSRFSEDLDFDNFELTSEDFDTLTIFVKKELELLGFSAEMRNIHRGAYHCYIRFPELIFLEGLSPYREEKILIQLDTEAHHFDYQPDQPILNKFDVFTAINATPTDVLLAQKCYAVLNRKRNKGRDFFDITFLLSRNVKPNYAYLYTKTGIGSSEELRKALFQKCGTLDMDKMGKDVSPFLFESKDIKKITLFAQYLQQASL